MPTATASPAREIMFKVTPLKYMSVSANVRLIGMLRAVTSVGRMSQRNRNKMTIAKIAPTRRLFKTESTTILM